MRITLTLNGDLSYQGRPVIKGLKIAYFHRFSLLLTQTLVRAKNITNSLRTTFSNLDGKITWSKFKIAARMSDQDDKLFCFWKNHSKLGKNLLNFLKLSRKNPFLTDVILDF